jgi:hypothetical protein
MNAIFNHEPIHYGEIVSLPFTGEDFHEIQSSLISVNSRQWLSWSFFIKSISNSIFN